MLFCLLAQLLDPFYYWTFVWQPLFPTDTRNFKNHHHHHQSTIKSSQLQGISHLLTLLCFFENIWHLLIFLYWVSPYQLLLTLGKCTWCHPQRNAYWGWSIPGLGCKKDFRSLPVGSSPMGGLIVCVHVGGFILLH